MIETFKARIEPEIPRHIGRWGGQVDPDMNESWKPGPTFNSVSEWENNVNQMRDFVRRRSPYATQHIIDKFGLTGTALLEVDVNDNKAGMAKIYHKRVPKGGYSGKHFKRVPIVMKAVTHPGYRFVHWIYSGPDGQKTIEDSEMVMELTGATTLTAFFAENIIDSGLDVLINEINYHSPDASNSGDWVELYNKRGDFIDLSNWTLLDGDDSHVFTFREGRELKPYGYIVVCENMGDFKAIFPEVDNITGDLEFKFSNGGEVIRLFDSGEKLIDSVRYDDKAPWPEMADGKGPTLELIHPDLDNDLPANWTAVDGTGTPGQFNHTITGLPSEKNNHYKGAELFSLYPNPVRTTASISYVLKNSGHVTLSVVGITGREVCTIVNRHQNANTYSLIFDAGQWPNGVYLYILKVDHRFVDAGRMIVVH